MLEASRKGVVSFPWEWGVGGERSRVFLALIPKPEKGTQKIKEENYRPIFLMDTDVKILNKAFANQV